MRETKSDGGQSLEAILGDFNPSCAVENKGQGRTVTVWVSPEYKAKFDRLQDLSKRDFGKRLKEVFYRTIDLAEERVS